MNNNSREEQPISEDQPRKKRGRKPGSTNVKPLDAAKAHAGLLAELSQLAPISNEPVYNAQKRFSPQAFEITRQNMLTELLDTLPAEEAQSLLADIRKEPGAWYSPSGLDSWKRWNEAWKAAIESLKTHTRDAEHIRYLEGKREHVRAEAARKPNSKLHQMNLECWEELVSEARQAFNLKWPEVTLEDALGQASR
jgi:hypothetical protein